MILQQLPRLTAGQLLAAFWAGGCAVIMQAYGAAASQQNVLWLLLVYTSPIPLFAASLRHNQATAVLTCLAATGMAFLLLTSALAINFTLFIFLPTALISFLALRRREIDGDVYWYPSGFLLTDLLLYAIAVFALLALIASSQDGGLMGVISMLLAEIMEARLSADPNAMMMQSLQGLDPEQQKKSLEVMMSFFAQMLPAITIISFAFFMIVTGIVTQRALSGQNWAKRPDPTLYDLMLPSWLIMAVAAVTILSFVTPPQLAYFFGNVTIVLLLPYLFLGMAFFHSWARLRKHRHLFLIPIYVLLMFGWPMFLVVLFGVLESFFNFRKLLQPKDAA